MKILSDNNLEIILGVFFLEKFSIEIKIRTTVYTNVIQKGISNPDQSIRAYTKRITQKREPNSYRR